MNRYRDEHAPQAPAFRPLTSSERAEDLRKAVEKLPALMSSQNQLRALIDAINALPYCPFCGQGHAMHTEGCKIRPMLVTP